MMTVSTVPSVNTGGSDELSKFCQSRCFGSAAAVGATDSVVTLTHGQLLERARAAAPQVVNNLVGP
jgi:hypothetical protein